MRRGRIEKIVHTLTMLDILLTQLVMVKLLLCLGPMNEQLGRLLDKAADDANRGGVTKRIQ